MIYESVVFAARDAAMLARSWGS